jgi:type I restriction enzyme S subunit
MKCETRKLDEVIEALIDYRGKTPSKTQSGVKLITAKVIKDGFIQDGPHEYIAQKDYDPWMRRGLPERGDILLTTEAPLGQVAQIRDDEKIALAQRVILLRAKSSILNQCYFFHLLKSPLIQARLRARSTGTTVLGIKQSELRQIEIPFPGLSIQRCVASVLSAYDDLIENNARRIKMLEEMAKLIYREWFVELKAPGVKLRKATAEEKKVTGKDVFPEGWEIKTLGDLSSEFRRAVDPAEIDPDTPYIGLEHMPRQSIALDSWGVAKEVQSTKLLFSKGEILFGKIRPYFHKVGIAPTDGVCSSDIIVIVPKEEDLHALVLACVSSTNFINHATQTSQGTKMPRANWDVLLNYSIPTPPERLLARFSDLIESKVTLILNLVATNRNLRETRDLLLPKLVSGEVEV